MSQVRSRSFILHRFSKSLSYLVMNGLRINLYIYLMVLLVLRAPSFQLEVEISYMQRIFSKMPLLKVLR